MRSAFIIASFALTLLAAPIQVPKDKAPAVAEIVAPTEVALDARLNQDFHGGVSEEAYVEKRVNRKAPLGSEGVGKHQNGKNNRSEEAEDEDVEVVEKRFNRSNQGRSEEVEAEDIEVVEKRFNRSNQGRSEEVEKRFNRSNQGRSEEVEAEDVEVVEKRFNRSNQGRSEETGVTKGVNWIKPVVRNVYNNMAGIIEALKTRGFNSANYVLPAREVV